MVLIKIVRPLNLPIILCSEVPIKYKSSFSILYIIASISSKDITPFTIPELEKEEEYLEKEIKERMMKIPNIIDSSVPIGKDDFLVLVFYPLSQILLL